MSPRSQLSIFIDTILINCLQKDNLNNEQVQDNIIEDYKKLNEKCDDIITKIKIRKEKK